MPEDEEYSVLDNFDGAQLIYRQVDRLAGARSAGEYAFDDLEVLEAFLQPYKDSEWKAAYGKMDGDGEENFVPRLRACILLMSKMNLWPPRPRTIRRGEELLQGL